MRRGASEKTVHDLRSAIRRLQATLDAISNFSSNRPVEKLLDKFKDQMDSSNDLRDLQVMILDLTRNAQVLPVLGAIKLRLKAREAELLEATEQMANHENLDGIDRRLRKIRQSVADISPTDLSKGLLKAVDPVYSTILEHYRTMDTGQPASIHQVRITLRKFRYLLEIIHPLLPDMPASHLQHIRGYQTLMGEIQDTTIFTELAQEYSEGMATSWLETMRHFYKRRMSEALSHFLERREEILSFWRPNPEAVFPWAGEWVSKGIAMNLYIIRHAIAVEPGTSGYEDDSQRPLTDIGRNKMKQIARAIRKLDIKPNAILSSPYVRARETAEILANKLHLNDKLSFSDNLIPTGDFERLVNEITATYTEGDLALVGHEPMLSQFIGWLATGGSGMSLTLKKGGLCFLKADDLATNHRATLEWLLAPATLISMAE